MAPRCQMLPAAPGPGWEKELLWEGSVLLHQNPHSFASEEALGQREQAGDTPTLLYYANSFTC